MNINDFIKIDESEKPLDRLAINGGFVSIFRVMCCIGDSLSSGEFELRDKDGNISYLDTFEYSWGQYIARSCGLEALNFSCGGLSCHTFFNAYIKVNSPFIEEKKCQAYFIALGVNDFNHMDELYTKGFGTLEDVDFQNEESIKCRFL